MFLALYPTETITLVILDTHHIPSMREILTASGRSMMMRTAGQTLNDSLTSLPIAALPSAKPFTSSRPQPRTIQPRISPMYVAALAVALILL